jgi:hypothetical protein
LAVKCVHYKSLFATVVFIGTTLFALQQLSGINSVFYFSSTVFRSVGVPASFANICMGVSNLSGELCAFEICYVHLKQLLTVLLREFEILNLTVCS